MVKIEGFIGTRRASEIIGCAQGTILDWIRKGKIPAQKIDGEYLIDSGEAVYFGSHRHYAPEGYLTTDDAGKIVGVTFVRILQLCWKNKFKSISLKLGNGATATWVEKASFEEWIKKHENKHTE